MGRMTARAGRPEGCRSGACGAGGEGMKVAIGLAKETQRVERLLDGGLPRRGGRAGLTSWGAWQALSLCVDTVSTLLPICNLKE